MLLMVEKGIRGGICHAIHRYKKANNKYMNEWFRYGITIPHVLEWQWMGSFTKVACRWFKWKNSKSKFTQKFIQSYHDNRNKGYFLEVTLIILNIYKRYIMIFHSCLQERRLTNARNLSAICMTRNIMLHTKVKALNQALDYGLMLDK